MDSDDRTRGHILSRREVIAVLGAGAYAVLSGPHPARAQAQGASRCIVRPEQTEGPYFVDELLHRADVRSGPTDGTTKPGAPLELTIVVSRLAGERCQPVPGANVDLW